MALVYLKNKKGAMFLVEDDLLKIHFPETFKLRGNFSIFLKSETDRQLRFIPSVVLKAYMLKISKIYKEGNEIIIKVKNFKLKTSEYNCQPYKLLEDYDPIIHDFIHENGELYQIVY